MNSTQGAYILREKIRQTLCFVMCVYACLCLYMCVWYQSGTAVNESGDKISLDSC